MPSSAGQNSDFFSRVGSILSIERLQISRNAGAGVVRAFGINTLRLIVMGALPSAAILIAICFNVAAPFIARGFSFTTVNVCW